MVMVMMMMITSCLHHLYLLRARHSQYFTNVMLTKSYEAGTVVPGFPQGIGSRTSHHEYQNFWVLKSCI